MSSIELIYLFLQRWDGAKDSDQPKHHANNHAHNQPTASRAILPILIPTSMSNYMKHENNHHPIVVWCKSTEIPYAASIKNLLSPRPVTVRQFDQGPFANEVSQKLRQLGAAESKLAVFAYGNYLGGYKEVLGLLRKGGEEIDLLLAGEESISHTSATEDMSSSETEAQGYTLTRSQRRIFKQTSPHRPLRCFDAGRKRATATMAKSAIHHAKSNPFPPPQLTRNQSTMPRPRSQSQSFNQTWDDSLSGGLLLSFRSHSF